MSALEIPTGTCDDFLNNPPDQPKLTVGEYVESSGLLVPARYATIREGLDSSTGAIIRSEHPLEYAGPSDMLTSFELRPNDQGEIAGTLSGEDIFNYSLGTGMSASDHKRVAESYGYSWEEYYVKIGFSTWSIVNGINRAMFADPSIPGRYYVSSIGVRADIPDQRGRATAFHVLDAGEQTTSYYSNGFDEELPAAYGDAQELIDFYETVRSLGRFDPKHCPIIEFQSSIDGATQWFLQYHRGRDAVEQPVFTIEDEIKGIKMKYVMGSTAVSGADLEVAVGFADGRRLTYYTEMKKAELIARLGVPVMLIEADMADDLFYTGTYAHGSRSLWSKPPLTLFNETSERDIAGMFGNNVHTREVLQGIELMFANLHVTSDGKQAFVRSI